MDNNRNLPSILLLHRRATEAQRCDVVLCLSVYHHWHHDFGREGAQHLRTLGTKAQRFMFFELALNDHNLLCA